MAKERPRNTAGKGPTSQVSGKDHRTTRPTEGNRTPQPRATQPKRPDDWKKDE